MRTYANACALRLTLPETRSIGRHRVCVPWWWAVKLDRVWFSSKSALTTAGPDQVQGLAG